ncbi:hypothetical protein CEUSTIGMA_g3882.t1 [Chlamydomonas eustigma]|uniref:Cyclin-like domain-containing protein n=1 Tax=Chlamydomonas eustigma TaxID=1157962 RepID=A0A250X036_9CHLO|nr:hypothetical protein CEUSTIGMA_g3882.t1 [Chlamydomonas eustigma]|eukprot:GAX76437.1 hypothetical protein CEUSTIGMA_g3882.t1 [Chlamydomonas eustigma]
MKRNAARNSLPRYEASSCSLKIGSSYNFSSYRSSVKFVPSMDFANSSHKSRWMFTADQLVCMRSKIRKEGLASGERSSKSAKGSEDCNAGLIDNDITATSSSSVSLEDQLKVLRFYERQIMKLCATLNYPPKVKATAIMYLKRFYLIHSCLTHDPARLMLTSVYLAGKIEESYIGAEEFCKLMKQDPKAVLGSEVLLLQGLSFDLIIHSPYRALQGLIEEICGSRTAGQAGDNKDLLSSHSSLVMSTTSPPPPLEDALSTASNDQIEKWRLRSVSAIDALMLSDAPLQYPPGQLALAALRSSLRASGIPIPKFLHRIVCKSLSMSTEDQDMRDSVDQQAHQINMLVSALDDIDRLGAAGSQKVDEEEVRAIDLRLKTMRAQSNAETEDVAAGEAEKAERREAKLRARKEKQAASEARILGVVQQ